MARCANCEHRTDKHDLDGCQEKTSPETICACLWKKGDKGFNWDCLPVIPGFPKVAAWGDVQKDDSTLSAELTRDALAEAGLIPDTFCQSLIKGITPVMGEWEYTRCSRRAHGREIDHQGMPTKNGSFNWTWMVGIEPGSPEHVAGLKPGETRIVKRQPPRQEIRHAQVGGDHYRKRKIQPWDIWAEYDLNGFEASIIKYILRHRDKNGVQDLKKARHTLDKLIELEEGGDGAQT